MGDDGAHPASPAAVTCADRSSSNAVRVEDFAVDFAVEGFPEEAQPALLKRLEVRLVQAVWRHQRATAKRLGARGPLGGGGVCF